MPSIYRFRVFRCPDGRHHIVGYDSATASACISPPLVKFDGQVGAGWAVDGTEYTLSGCPALDMNAGAAWMYYRAENGIAECTDVTPHGSV
jgi:hypothetical protein